MLQKPEMKHICNCSCWKHWS